VVTINSPTAITYTTTSILINISATDPSGVDTIWFFNGTGNKTYTGPITRTYLNGVYTLHAWANDTLGNEGYANVTFTVNWTAPTPPRGGGGESGPSCLVTAWIEADESLDLYPGESETLAVDVVNGENSCPMSNLRLSVEGDIPSSWYSIMPSSINMGQDETRTFSVEIEVPENAEARTYESAFKASNSKILEHPFDLNVKAREVEKPEIPPPPPEKPPEKPPVIPEVVKENWGLILIAGILTIVILIALGIIVPTPKKEKPKVQPPKGPVPETIPALPAVPKTVEEQRKKGHILGRYIDTCVKRGQTEKVIKDALTSNGWDKEVVESAFQGRAK
jgi:hypothetical protein